jgi:hypothetical protein
LKEEGSGAAPEQSGLAETYARSTSLGWLRIIVTRGTQLLWIKIITQPEILSKDLYGFVSFVALGASLVAGLAVPWVVWVMTQRGLAEKDPDASNRLIHQMVVYGIIASLVFAPLLAFAFIFVASVSTGVPLLAVEGISMMIPIAVAASLFQLFSGVYNCYLKIERNVVVGAARTVAYQLIPLALFLVTRSIMMIFWGWVIADVLMILVAIPTSGLRRQASLYRPRWPATALVVFTLPIFFLTVFDAFRGVISSYFTFVFFGSANFAVYNLMIGMTTMATDAILTLMIPFSPIIIVMLKTRPARVGIALGTVLKMVAHAVLYVSPILIFCGTPVLALITSSQYLGPESTATLSFATVMMAATILNALFLNLIGAKGQTYRLLYFEAFYALTAIPFYYLFAILGWLQVLGIAGMAICTALSFIVTLLLLMWQTKELKQIGWQALIRVAALGIPQAGVTFLLSLWLAPIDLVDLAIILAVTLLSLFLFSGFLSCLKKSELEIVSRASKGKLDRLIRFYERLAPRSRGDDENENH